ncbi:MAG: hypothetical protein WD638_07035 [Nitriliruptoraceae bacterium]
MNVEEQLRRTQDDATHRLLERPGEVTAALAEGDRRRRRTRAGAVAAGVAAVAVAVVGLTAIDWPGSGSFPIDPVDQDVADPPPGDEGPGDEDSADEAPEVGQPVLTMFAEGGWSVRVSPDGDAGWCITARRGGADPAGSAGEACAGIAAPDGGGADEVLSPVRSQTDGEAELLFGTVDDRADDVAVVFRGGERSTATTASGGRLSFGVWALPLDGRIPVLVEALRAGEVIGARDLDEWTAAGPPASAEDEALIGDLLRFASEPTDANAGALPFAGQVGLGLGEEIIVTRSADELADPEAWSLDVEAFRGYVGPFSALDLAAGSGPADTVVSVGQHPHCASPPRAAPEGFADHRRLSVQPDPETTGSCLEWWTVDLYLDDAGTIDAVTLDLFAP